MKRLKSNFIDNIFKITRFDSLSPSHESHQSPLNAKMRSEVLEANWRTYNWTDKLISGEVERLLREYRQNQELVRNIGANYYQIIYPVQLRHHEKMGISTREVGVSKVMSLRSDDFLLTPPPPATQPPSVVATASFFPFTRAFLSRVKENKRNNENKERKGKE